MDAAERHQIEQDAITAAWEAQNRDRPRTNWDRATEALGLCEHMKTTTGVDDLASQVSDALAHLMHLCRLCRDEDGHDIEFEECLTRGRMNFEAECDEDPDNA